MGMRIRVLIGGLLVVGLSPVAPANIAASDAVAVASSSASASAATGDTFVPISSFRLVSTLSGIGTTATPLGAGEIRSFQVAGVGAIPASAVSAVVVDIAPNGLDAAESSAFTAWATGATRPTTPALRFAQYETSKSNTAIVPLSAGGKISVHNAAGSAGLTVDVQGYFISDGSGGGFHPVTSTRMVSTLNGQRIALGEVTGTTPVDIALADADSVVPAGAQAVFANVRVSSANMDGGLQLGPGGISLSTSGASVNYEPGMYSESGMAIKLSDDGRIRLKNLTAAAGFHVVIDIQGYWSGDSTLGGYFNPLPSLPRLYDSTTSGRIPANGSKTFTIGTVAGLDDPGMVSSFVLTVRVQNWLTSGDVTVYNPMLPAPAVPTLKWTGSATPDVGVTTTAILMPTGNGEVTLKNSGAEPVTITLAAQGWFSKALPPEAFIDTEVATDDELETEDAGTLPPAPEPGAEVVTLTLEEGNLTEPEVVLTEEPPAGAAARTDGGEVNFTYKTWGACGAFDSDWKIIRVYEPRLSMSANHVGNHANLNCGNRYWGLGHILYRNHDQHWENYSTLVGRPWRHLADFAMAGAYGDPTVVTYNFVKDTYCYSRKVYLYFGSRLVEVIRVQTVVGHSGRKIRTSYPSNRWCGNSQSRTIYTKGTTY